MEFYKKITSLKIANFILFFIAIYSFFAATYSELKNMVPWNFYSFYAYIIIIACLICGIIAVTVHKHETMHLPWKKKYLFYFIFFLIFWYLIRWPVILEAPTWFDEITQYIPFWELLSPTNIPLYAARQQQLPLDYYFSEFILRLLGPGEIAMKFNSILFGLISCLIFFITAIRVRLTLPLFIVSTLIFLGQNTFLQYSSEARPMSLVLTLTALNIYFLIESVYKNKFLLWQTLGSAILLAFSTGLQPILHLFFITLFFLLWGNNLFKNKLQFVYINFFIPVILTIPFDYKIYSLTVGTMQNFKSESFWGNLQNLFLNFDITQIIFFFHQVKNFNILILTSLIITTLLLFRYSGKKWPKILILNLSTLSYVFLFPLAYTWIWSIMDWPLFGRYFITWIYTVILLNSMLLNNSLRFFLNKKNPHYKTIQFIFSILLILPMYTYFIQPEQSLYIEHTQYPDLRKLLETETPNGRNMLYYVPDIFSPEDDGGYLDETGTVYNTKHRLFLVNKIYKFTEKKYINMRPDMKDILKTHDLDDFKKNVDLRIIFYCGRDTINPICEKDHRLKSLQNARVIKWNSTHLVYELPIENNSLDTISEIMSEIYDQYSESPFIYSSLKSLSYYYLSINKSSEVEGVLKKIENIKFPKSMLTDSFVKWHQIFLHNIKKQMEENARIYY
jgi:hypothetical protein